MCLPHVDAACRLRFVTSVEVTEAWQVALHAPPPLQGLASASVLPQLAMVAHRRLQPLQSAAAANMHTISLYLPVQPVAVTVAQGSAMLISMTDSCQ